MSKLFDHAYIASTILLTVYSQVIMRWQISKLASPPDELGAKLVFFISNLWRPWILTALVATFLAGVAWMVVLSKFKLSYAFPFMALNFFLIMMAGAIFFGESLTGGKIIGNLLIITGVIALARSQG